MLTKHYTILDIQLGFTMLVFLTLLNLTQSEAVVIRHDKSDADALLLGERFNAVGRVLPDGGCTLIAPTWVATVAHVARSITTESKIQFSDKKYTVKRKVIHPKAIKREKRPPEVDLALVELAEPVKKIKPIELYRKGKELSKMAYIVGYGDYGNPRTRLKRTDQKRRAVTNIINDTGPRRIFMKFDEPPTGTKYEGIGGPGDSGGPALLEEEDKLYLVGISSGSMNGKPGQYGVTDVYTRVTSYVDWIEKTIHTDGTKP